MSNIKQIKVLTKKINYRDNERQNEKIDCMEVQIFLTSCKILYSISNSKGKSFNTESSHLH